MEMAENIGVHVYNVRKKDTEQKQENQKVE